MRAGDIVRAKKIRAYAGRSTFEITAADGGFFVFGALGYEKEQGELDPVAAMYDLGWSHPDIPDPRELATAGGEG